MSDGQPLQLVIFDMAGTTVRDDGQVPRAFTAALARHGIHASPARIAALRGSSKRQAVRQFAPDGDADAVYASFRDELTREFATHGIEAVSGAADLFAWLRRNEVGVALNTGFDRDIALSIVAALGWGEGALDAVVCGDDVAEGRPAPDLIRAAMKAAGVSDPHRVANVGDTALDLEAGARAGVRWNIGVLTGAHDRTVLTLAPHTDIVESIADLPRLFIEARATR